MKKTQVILLSAAFAAGAGSTTMLGDLVDQAQAAKYEYRLERLEITATAEQKAAIGAALTPILCPALDADWELSGDKSCSLANYFQSRSGKQPSVMLHLLPDGQLKIFAHALLPTALTVVTPAEVDGE